MLLFSARVFFQALNHIAGLLFCLTKCDILKRHSNKAIHLVLFFLSFLLLLNLLKVFLRFPLPFAVFSFPLPSVLSFLLSLIEVSTFNIPLKLFSKKNELKAKTYAYFLIDCKKIFLSSLNHLVLVNFGYNKYSGNYSQNCYS